MIIVCIVFWPLFHVDRGRTVLWNWLFCGTPNSVSTSTHDDFTSKLHLFLDELVLIHPYNAILSLFGSNTMNNAHDKTVSKSCQISYNCNLYDDEWKSHDLWLLELYWGFRCTSCWCVLLTVLITNTRVYCEWGRGDLHAWRAYQSQILCHLFKTKQSWIFRQKLATSSCFRSCANWTLVLHPCTHEFIGERPIVQLYSRHGDKTFEKTKVSRQMLLLF